MIYTKGDSGHRIDIPLFSSGDEVPEVAQSSGLLFQHYTMRLTAEASVSTVDYRRVIAREPVDLFIDSCKT
ncbi:hypothetical protein ISS96_00205 [Candidatus Bathyarchaeota archaeon]|nr:hypothetical protein [Candidatus Bathyarchaeota archaeon]